MSCEQIREDLSSYVRGEIEGDREADIAAHLEECAECRGELEGIRQVMDSIASADDDAVDRKAREVLRAGHEARASDIHLLPQADGWAVRFRVDGVLHETERLSRPLGQAVLGRLKAMGEMDVAETRLPQDGRIHLRIDGRDLDVRQTTMPTTLGEKLTMRLLDPSGVMLGIESLGMSDRQLADVREFLSSPSGLFIATGPTGCGKTTLLYSLLGELDAEKLNIVTVEDPVEYRLPGISQTHTNMKAGLGFSRALRYQLRSDPDAIMCGETRDLETMATLIQATITGHLTLTTLHTTSAPDVFRRLLNMGVEPFLIADTLRIACSMRLVRRVCDGCAQEREPTEGELTWLRSVRADVPTYGRVRHGVGCDACLGSGYRMRTGVFEVLKMDDRLRDVVSRGALSDELTDALALGGHAGRTLVRHGLEKIRAGETTIEEVAALAESL